MKNLTVTAGAILFVIGCAIATGIERNPMQAIYAVVFMGAACLCFNAHDRREKKTTEEKTTINAADMKEAA